MALRKSRAAKAGLIVIEIVGALLAAVAAVAALLFWRLQTGPVSLGIFRPSAAFAIERALPPDHRVVVGSAYLVKGAGRGELEAVIEDIVIEAPDGATIADAPRMSLVFSLADVLHGDLGVRHVAIVEPTLKIIRGRDRRLALDYAETETDAPRRSLFTLLTGGPHFRDAFQHAALVDAVVIFVDEASGRTWRAAPAEASISRRDEGYAAQLRGVFDIDGKPAFISFEGVYAEATERLAADIEVMDAPAGDLVELFFGARAFSFVAPLTGSASLVLTSDGRVVSSRLEGRVGAGEAQFAGRVAPISFIEFAASFDPEKGRFDVERLTFDVDGTKGALTGDVALTAREGARAPAAVAFALEGVDLVIDAKGALPAPLAIPSVAAIGVYDLSARRLAVSELAAQFLDVTLAGSISLEAPKAGEGGARPSPGVRASLAIDGSLDPERILRFWPVDLGAGAREFVATRMPRARVENVAFTVDLPAGALTPGAPFPDEALRLTFDIRDATAIYAPGMTPLSEASGSAVLTGNRFVVDVERGRVGRVAISEGEVEFTALSPKAQPTHYRFIAEGMARDILAVLNEEPLRLLDPTGLAPEQFLVGRARVRAQITRPNLRFVSRKDYQYKGSARFSGVTISEFYGGIDLADADGTLDLASRRMTVSANASFGGAPISLEWLQRFYADDGGARLSISGVVDSSTGDVFGVPTRRFLRGPVAFTAQAIGGLAAIESLTINADFSSAALTIGLLDWEKPVGESAAGALDIVFAETGVEVRSLELTGAQLDIRGSARFEPGGALDWARLDPFRVPSAADVALAAARKPTGALELTLAGAYLNAGPLLEAAVEAGPPGEDGEAQTTDLVVRGRIDALDARAGARYHDVSLDLHRVGRAFDALDISARTAGGAPLSITLAPDGAVEARTEDVGALMRGLFGVTSVLGGRGSLTMRPDPVGERLAGTVFARDLRVVKAPLLARIFSAGSLTGLADLLNGQGIELTQAIADFAFRDGMVSISEARASGPSVGITAQGTIRTGAGGVVNLNGALAPAYAVNSLLGGTPVVGELFVNREGEGVLALSYAVHGESNAPTIMVNPLSALTPGFLRRIFEIERQPEPPVGAKSAPAPAAEKEPAPQ
ncbi:YhdP family protein [Amphiplicatus metriothermophilus]|uniref:AsmA-like C-terminal region n=1 Tax=Amphiplicatus metriothermophilus TaxID=1519374 RepID=A0A239Q109_9PROT|nr:AsmA-like C-terminal region-containing protein [Amphiplicatus metriothermophilus]MBB5520173.1 hypothetical protein [Amphiplicatus metriothermophilus]SNT75916.1 AsmA-like C-terminal region [Amphiplicatus metriothermophilus]